MTSIKNSCIHIFGASGSGTTSLGSELSKNTGFKHFDTDSYFWKATDPPFQEVVPEPERTTNLVTALSGAPNWVLSGSLCDWGDVIIPRLTFAVFLYLDPKIRMDRLKKRERARYGDRVDQGGDLYETHQKFIDWAKSYDTAEAPTRSLILHEAWMKKLPCPILRLNTENSLESLTEQVLDRLASLKDKPL